MSVYSPLIAWSGKDALSDSDPAKVISGSDFQTEFNGVAAVVNTKADVNGSATESFSATTAAAGTNTTQVATTSFVKTAIDNAQAFPVGSVFISVVSTDPATLLGYGTWAAFATGKMLVGIDAADTDFDTVEETGGAKTHTLTESEMPAHSHNYAGGEYSGAYDYGTNMSVNNLGTATDGRTHNYDTSTVGSGNAHNNMPPYIVTYMWKRTA